MMLVLVVFIVVAAVAAAVVERTGKQLTKQQSQLGDITYQW